MGPGGSCTFFSKAELATDVHWWVVSPHWKKVTTLETQGTGRRLERVARGCREATVTQMRNGVPCTKVEGAERQGERREGMYLSGTRNRWAMGTERGRSDRDACGLSGLGSRRME